jgi:cobalt-zinc-cadmium efflux system outer membrane protein
MLWESIEGRTGHPMEAEAPERGYQIPPDISLGDGLSEDEAGALALWNNPQLQADLADFGVARAALIEAGTLRNPVFSVLFPVGPKQLEETVRWPLDLLQRPWRLAFARRDFNRVAESMVQHGLNAVRDARIAHSDALLARERARLAQEGAGARSGLAEIAQARMRAGDLSELEASAASIDAWRAQDEAAQRAQQAEVAVDRLRLMLGMDLETVRFDLSEGDVALPPAPELPALLEDALQARPDMRAAELALESAGDRVGWERSRIAVLVGILDANGEGREGFELGPGLDVEVPLFSRNQAGRVRADAELTRASHGYVAARQRVALEVKEARGEYERARAALELWRDQIAPAADDALARADRAYAEGDQSYLSVLEMTRHLLETRERGAEVAAEARRAAARLDRSVGRRVFDGH